MDLLLDQDAFAEAGKKLKEKCEDLKQLRSDIKDSFGNLKGKWKSEAGDEFFKRFENELLSNLDKYSTVFEYMSQNLSTASSKYEEVFRAADAVANVQY